MRDLTKFRDHCRTMAAAEHKPECPHGSSAVSDGLPLQTPCSGAGRPPLAATPAPTPEQMEDDREAAR